MQILPWLFKVPQVPEAASVTASSGEPTRGAAIDEHRESLNSNRRGGKSGTRKFKSFAVLCRNDVSRACFYSTINLRRLGSFNRTHLWKVNSSTMKKEEIARGFGIKSQKATIETPSSNKVLPITDSNTAARASSSSSCDEPGKNDKVDKAKTMSRMKELLRWAAAARSEKGGKFIARKVLHFRNRSTTLKAIPDDDQLTDESPKISFRWDLESCSTTTSSTYSAISVASSSRIDQIGALLEPAPRKGNWITTDSEFVVLEL